MKAAQRILFFLIVLAIVLAFLELVLRFAGYAEPPRGLLPDGTPTKGDSYEQRNAYLDATFSDATFNILVFGDAWVFGLGCRLVETFPSIMEKKLAKERRLAIRVVNLGQPDFSSTEAAEVFRRSLIRYKADAAVILAGLTDCVPEDLKKSFFARKSFSVGENKITEKLRFFALASNIVLASKLNGRNIDPEDGKGYVARYRSIEQTQSSLLAMGKAAEEAGIPAVFIAYPILKDYGWLHPHYPLYSRRNLLIRSAADNFRQPILDLEKSIPPEKTSEYLHTWMRWPHLNPKGHRLVAEELLKILEPMLVGVPETL